MAFCPRAGRTADFSGTIIFRAGFSLVVSCLSRSISFCFLSDLFCVALLFWINWPGSCDQPIFSIPVGGVCCLPGTCYMPSPAASFVLRCDFLCIPISFFVLRTSSRPSPAALFRFVLRFPLSSDWLPFVPRTSSRPSPGTLFCFEPEFLLSSTDLLLFRALVPGLLPPALFCSAHQFPMHSHPHSFVSCAISFHFAAHILLSWSLAALCLSTFSKQ